MKADSDRTSHNQSADEETTMLGANNKCIKLLHCTLQTLARVNKKSLPTTGVNTRLCRYLMKYFVDTKTQVITVPSTNPRIRMICLDLRVLPRS